MDSRLREKVADYRGHVIHLRQNFTFAIRGPLVDEERGPDAREEHKSREQAERAIDALLNVEAEAAGAIKLSIPIIAEVKAPDDRFRRTIGRLTPRSFERVTLRGVNRGNGRLLTEPKLSNSDVDVAYPDVPWIADALAELAAIRERSQAISEALHAVAVKSFHGSRDAHAYRERIKDTQEKFAEKLKIAKKTDFTPHELTPAKKASAA